MGACNIPSGVKAAFDLAGRVAVITGAAGLLGRKHAEAIAEMGGQLVLLDKDEDKVKQVAKEVAENFSVSALGIRCNITSEDEIEKTKAAILKHYGHLDILINNAANNPKVEKSGLAQTRLENFSLAHWEEDIQVGLTGAFLMSRSLGSYMAKQGTGVILNIASDLAVIGPDQRIYKKAGLKEEEQPKKPITYSVVKTGLLGLTRYLATYWAEAGVRVNALSPGGVYTTQEENFITKLSDLIPMARMASVDEYKAAVVFLVSGASSYMTGHNLVMDGGRTVW